MRTDLDAKFFEQAPLFIARALRMLGIGGLDELPSLADEPPAPIAPVTIEDFRAVSVEEKEALAKAYYGRHGVAYFMVANPDARPACGHPLIDLSRQLSDVLPLSHPIAHPSELDPVNEIMWGPPDGTVKVIQRPDQDSSLEARDLHMHQDGVGCGGTISTVGLYCEGAPLWGGLTCFQNVLYLALHLARLDMKAFEALFHPTAVTLVRRQGPHALKIVGPVLYLNSQGEPQVFLRASGGDYSMSWMRHDALTRGRAFFDSCLRPLSPGSGFVQFSNPGQGCFFNNHIAVHGRTRFMERPDHRRVLARKWYADTAEHAELKRVPGLNLLEEYARLRPDLFGKELLQGVWRYDETRETNLRL